MLILITVLTYDFIQSRICHLCQDRRRQLVIRYKRQVNVNVQSHVG